MGAGHSLTAKAQRPEIKELTPLEVRIVEQSLTVRYMEQYEPELLDAVKAERNRKLREEWCPKIEGERREADDDIEWYLFKTYCVDKAGA
jgi:hypothetical protein